MKINRLSKKTSSHLQQHAKNPVEGHKWGDETLNTVKLDDEICLDGVTTHIYINLTFKELINDIEKFISGINTL